MISSSNIETLLRREYARFCDLFSGDEYVFAGSSSKQRGRKIIASLSGNHDLGFVTGVQPSVKERFDACFGPIYRVDVV